MNTNRFLDCTVVVIFLSISFEFFQIYMWTLMQFFFCVCVSVPLRYMKGRVSYDQINAVVQSINKAVTAKYKILHQSVRTLSNHARKLHQRFKDQDTKDTKGTFCE